MDISASPTKRDTRNKHIDHSKTIEYAQQGMSHAEIAKLQGCNPSNITRVLQRYGVIQPYSVITEYREHKADILAGLQHRLLSSISDSDIKKISPAQRIMAAGLLYDKERLERGQSTSNVDVRQLKLEIADLDKEIEKYSKSSKTDV